MVSETFTDLYLYFNVGCHLASELLTINMLGLRFIGIYVRVIYEGDRKVVNDINGDFTTSTKLESFCGNAFVMCL